MKAAPLVRPVLRETPVYVKVGATRFKEWPCFAWRFDSPACDFELRRTAGTRYLREIGTNLLKQTRSGRAYLESEFNLT